MNRRGVGVSFCFISAFLFSIKYISASIFGMNAVATVTAWNAELYNNFLKCIGNELNVVSVISLAIGAVYLVLSEIKKE